MDHRLPLVDLFDIAYLNNPPWDIGRPQPALMALVEAGLVHGRVLDVGCGTGELALALAARGHEVVGLDASALAIERARKKAAERGLPATFVVGNALALEPSAGPFDTVVDCGLFHVFSRAGRRRYVEGLGRVLAPGGLLHLLCFSDREAGFFPPWRVSRPELALAFGRGWHLSEVRDARFESLRHKDGARAFLATVARMPATTLVH